jgi:hypothetical protein
MRGVANRGEDLKRYSSRVYDIFFLLPLPLAAGKSPADGIHF